ncbi:MAG: HK97 family phage prohead protease [Vicinamibacterales bacterium]
MTEQHERRFSPRVALALTRREGAEGPGTLAGHAAVFNQRAEIYPGFFEEIAPGAFAESIRADDIFGLWQHRSDQVLGRLRAKSLRLAEDDVGLATEIDLPATALGADVAQLVGRGDVTGMSFGFNVLDQEWITLPDGADLRIVKRVKLWEVSPVTFPAYDGTDLALRARDLWRAARDKDAAAPLGRPAPKAPDFTILRARLRLAGAL